MASLLPPNSTALEKALEQATASIGDIPTPLRQLWDAYTCPAELLPWLAWSYAVDQWDDEWTTQQKRETVNQAILIHQKKGTPKAMKTAIAALGYQLELVEWWQTNGEHPPGTFGIDIRVENGQTMAATQTLLAAIKQTKNARSHLWGIRYQLASRGQQRISAGQGLGLMLHVQPLPPEFLNTVTDDNNIILTTDSYYIIDEAS